MERTTGIVQSVDFGLFCDAFRDHDRKDQFSYEAKRALFDYLESRADDMGEPIELDVIALCCEYNEEAPEEIAANYDIEIPGSIEEENEQEEGANHTQRRDDIIQEYLAYNTQFVALLDNGNMVYAAF